MTIGQLVAVCILLPIISAFICRLLPSGLVRRIVVIATVLAITCCSFILLFNGPFEYTPGSLGGLSWDTIILVLDYALLLYFFYIGIKRKSILVLVLTLVQAIPLIWFEFILGAHAEVAPVFYGDYLSLIMSCIISLVGGLICIFGLRYMDDYEAHHNAGQKSRQPVFFFFLVLFLGVMNALVFSNNLLWLYFFWEVTTMCSYRLIGHDRTPLALHNATRALWMNSIGGCSFVAAIIIFYLQNASMSLQDVVSMSAPSALMLTVVACLALTGFTKSAQFPFQTWLLGAMVAPTPVSALLHSSTMVKAGVYLILRLAPAFYLTNLSTLVAIVGGISFVAGSALAISQSNGKRILAYSTIANLGLIIVCAGLNTPLAIAAGIILLSFHAISKALLFMCVGQTEHSVGSRDLEDMYGLINKFPVLTVITIIGILTMLLPPFGVLVSKWAAVEAASTNPIILILLALGSALTMVYYSKWLGKLIGGVPSWKNNQEHCAPLVYAPLALLAASAVVLSFVIAPYVTNFIAPYVQGAYGDPGLTGQGLSLVGSIGTFNPIYIYAVLLLFFVLPLFTKLKPEQIQEPYMCGENYVEGSNVSFKSTADAPVNVSFGSFYLTKALGEGTLKVWINGIAIISLVALFGVVWL